MHGEGGDGDVGVVVGRAGQNIVDVDLLAGAVGVFEPVGADGDVLGPGRLDAGGHGGEAGRAIRLDRRGAAQDSGGEAARPPGNARPLCSGRVQVAS